MAERRADVAVIGAGILGLAHAWQAARAGKRVVVLERNAQAAGASVRNFGLIQPAAMSAGMLHQMAMRSRELWLDLLNTCKLTPVSTGSMVACYREDEEAVGKEFGELASKQGFACEWVDSKRAAELSDALRPRGLRGGVYSTSEITVDPRTLLRQLPRLLAERYRVETVFSSPVRRIELPVVETLEDKWLVQQAIVCAGDDFETLYPEQFRDAGLSRCKLQMMRTIPQGTWRLGPALAGGLTMRTWPCFEMCTTLEALRKRVASEMPAYNKWGIQVLVTESSKGELTIGCSHEYGQGVDFFDRAEIDELILDYLDNFAAFPDKTIEQRWNGYYARHTEKPFIISTPAKGVLVITGLGEYGMTLGLGLAERVSKKFFE